MWRYMIYIRNVKYLQIVLFTAFLILFSLVTVHAQDLGASSADPAIPERNGVYNDPQHPGVKVRVFVHPAKPETNTSPVLTCSLSDPESTAVVDRTGWNLSSNWTYNLNPTTVPSSVGSSNLSTIANTAFNNWTTASNSKVTFVRGADSSVKRSAYDGQNIIAWGRTNGSALGVTYTRYYTQTGQVVDVDTIMNVKFPWKWSGGNNTCAYSDAYDAQDILTHELGHWLGLDDEYDSASYQHATMYGYGSKGEVKKDTLTTGDKSGVFAIYNP